MEQEYKLVELDFCCPECHCSQWYVIDENDLLYGCGRCHYVCSFDLGDSEEINNLDSEIYDQT